MSADSGRRDLRTAKDVLVQEWAAAVADRVVERYARERRQCGGKGDAEEHLRLAVMAELVVEGWRDSYGEQR